MPYTPPERHDAIKVTVDKVVLDVTSDPYVVYTFRGFAPVVNIRTDGGEDRTLYLSSKSLSEQLHNLLLKNNEEWIGMKVRVWKDSEDRFARYMVEEIDDDDAEASADTPPDADDAPASEEAKTEAAPDAEAPAADAKADD